MKVCPSCNHEQESGKFCGKCGTQLNEQATMSGNPSDTIASEGTSQVETSEQIEKIKLESKLFFSYLFQQIKTPSAHFEEGKSGLKNSLMSIGLYIILTALAVYAILRIDFFYYDYGPSWISISVYFAIFTLLILGINAVAIFTTSKLFSADLTFVETIQKIGGYFALPILFTAVSLLLTFINSYAVAIFIVYLGSIIAFGVIPAFVMIRLLTIKTKAVDALYAFLFYGVVTITLGVIVGILIADSAIGELLSDLGYYL